MGYTNGNRWEGSLLSTPDEAVLPIAIVGISGRFPGDAENPKKLWDMMAEGRSALSDIPADRFNVDAFYHPHNERQGTVNVKKAHFMQRDISAFDAPFFSMSIAEAKAMDPQQRMALECTYEALENAGVRMEDVDGSNTACYVGCFTRDYSDMLACDREDLPLYQGTGTGSAIMSNRISWFFNMKGPSISLDTACSSSMAALHLACQSLRTGESTMAVVGGTNLMLLPDIMGAMTRLHFLSPDGKCQSFDHKGNGYSRGEGAAFCALKPLHLALANGDVIRGVIRNTAVNQDGNTPGITLPSAEAQEALIRRVYAEAGLSLAETAYVEAHGTGTPAGDPVEAAALGATFGKARVPGKPLYIGSVKSNVGHLEGGSGLVQVVKAVMMLEKGQIPPSIWFEKPNPRIPMDEWNLAVPTMLMPWPVDGLRRISINSFGYGGTNAHCILDDAYHYLKARRLIGNHNVQSIGGASPASTADSGSLDSSDPIPYDKLSSSPKLLVLSSHEQGGIQRTARLYGEYLAHKLKEDSSAGSVGIKEDRKLLAKFARTLATRRSILPWKSFAIAGTIADAVTQLEKSVIAPLRSAGNMKKLPKVGLVFTGQGAQWYAMGRELYSHPVFRESLEAAGRHLARIGASWSLVTEMWRDEKDSRLESADLSQPICTALQVALVDLLRHWNIKYDAVVGHSSGEIAAAYAKGALTRESAWEIAYHRGHLSSCIRGFAPGLQGAMLATGLGPEDAEKYIARLTKGNATVACINSPASTTLSGDADAIDELEQLIKADGAFARKLRVDVAYHSPHMHVIAEQYRQALGDLVPLAEADNDDEYSRVRMFSSLTGQEVKNSELGAQYWVANMTGQVNFLGAVQGLLSFSDDKGTGKRRAAKKAFVQHLIEVGPHAALKGPLRQILDHDSLKGLAASDVSYGAVLQRGKDACESALAMAGRLFQIGLPVDISCVNGDPEPGRSLDGFLVDLPPFSWNHSLKYWSESHTAKAHRFREHPRKDLFGSETLEMLGDEPRYRNILRVTEVPWVQDHKVQGSILYPAAGMMIAAIEAMHQRADKNTEIEGYELRDVIIGKAIVVPQDEDGVETMLSIKPFRLGSQALTAVWNEFRLYSRKEVWELNCSGLIRVQYKSKPAAAAEKSGLLFANEEALAAQELAGQYRRVRQDCSRTQNPRHFYEHLTSIGLYYGPVFQNIVEARKGDFESACKVTIPDTKSTMPHGFEFPHVIHPATLDGMIQQALLACTAVDEDLTVAMVPTAIGRLYVSASVPTEPGRVLPGFASTGETDAGTREARIVLGDSEEFNKPLIIFEGVRSATLASAAAGEAAASVLGLRKLTSAFHWKPDLTLLDKTQIKALCDVEVGDRGRVDRKLLEELEIASLIYIKRVMKECPREEAEGFAWNFRLFWEYMEHCYQRGKLGKLCYQTPNANWLDMAPEEEEALLARVAASSPDGAVLIEHGEHLPAILRGQVPPLQILMRDNFLQNFYKDGLDTERHYAQMAFYIGQLAHKNPNMKILEIGAGTGGASLPVLEALGGNHGTAPRFESYTFTDISIGYFEKAQEKLAPWVPFMKFVKLNIEEDPLTQGPFEEASYDLIVASNVLHATRFIETTLKNTRKLLKPNGKLVLSEITNPSQKMRSHMIVGSLEGWWYGEEDGRHYGPTLTVDQWHDEMLKAGFDGVEVDLGNSEDERDLNLSVMVTSPTAPQLPAPPKKVLVVLPAGPEPDVQAFADKMAERLRAAGTANVVILKLQEAAGLDLDEDSNNFTSCLFLLDAQRQRPFLPEVSTEDWEALKKLMLQSWDVTYVTRGGTVHSENPSANLMSGMARSIRSETPGLGLATLDLDYNKPLDSEDTVQGAYKVFVTACAARDAARPDWEYAVRDGVPMVQRILLDKEMNDMCLRYSVLPKPEPAPFRQPGRPLKLEVGTPGRLDTLRFNDDPTVSERVPLGEREVEIEIKAAGLNFKDVMVAMGQLSQPALGVDASGVVLRVGDGVTAVKAGDAVFTWKLGTFGNLTRAHESMVQPIPRDMDFVTAASLPVVYSTAHYALSRAGRLRKGESILIHSAAGGVGQAAIILAQHIGAEVFVTVSSEAKKQLLIDRYGIPEDHIFNSRDTSFVNGIKRLTANKGVDVVLNSLAGEPLRLTWRCIARFGRFVEMGQKDIVGNTGLDMEPFLRNTSFHAINLLDLLDHDPPTAAEVFAEVAALLRDGVAQPVAPITSMPFSRVEEAFRTMQTGKHLGKIVLEAVDDDTVPVIPAPLQPVQFAPDATYVIAGGSGGLGRATAEWMVRSGARNILLLSRSGTAKESVRQLLVRLEAQGARVAAPPCDVGDRENLRRVLDQCAADGWPKVCGVIQGAMVLRDAIYQHMTREQFLGATHGKVQGSWNLHELLPADLDFFVLLSSSVGIAGSRGQGNYSAGNAYQDALAHYRRGKGLNACSIDVGMVLGVGFLAEETTAERVHENTKSWSFIGIREPEFFGILQAAITGTSLPGAPPVKPQLITGLGTGGMMAQGAEKYPWWFNDMKFAHIVQVDTHQVVAQDKVADAGQLQALLQQATSLDQAADIVAAALVKKLAKSMMVSVEDIEASRPVSSYGVDSLLAVELRSWIYSEVQADISVFDLLSNIAISSLARKIVSVSKAVPAAILANE
ncbi:putative polyketide synthase [Parathielavia appendiculata]|uniref:Polyketide synthase n=1 Tax=Parathielavia appendiculata TaxID=2587402 RepID=A0AAN6TPF8_9PEZI|nr:putative polyketide synthase [Parathielavia appendiculata]